MPILSYILSVLGLISIITASLIKGKNMKKILFFVFLANVLVATGYLIGGSGINGAWACYFGSVQAIVNYFYDSKNKPVPKWLIAVYAVLTVAINIWVSGGISLISIIVIIAGMAYIMCIIQKSGKQYRFWMLVNVSIWCFYDVFSHSYQILLTHVPQLIFNVIGIIIHDRKANE